MARGALQAQARRNLFEAAVPLTGGPAEDYRQFDQQIGHADSYLSQRFHYHAHNHQPDKYNEAGVEQAIAAALAHVVQDPRGAVAPGN